MRTSNKHQKINTRINLSADGLSVIHALTQSHGTSQDALFILDTGSNYSMVREPMEIMIGDSPVRLTANSSESSIFPTVDGRSVQGILGTDFLLRNKLVIDYAEETLSNEPFHCEAHDGYASIPMTAGLDNFGVPLLAVENEGNCFFFIADTGSNTNLILKRLFRNGAFHTGPSQSCSLVALLRERLSVDDRSVRFNLALSGFHGICLVPFEDTFGVVDRDDLVSPYGAEGFRVDGLIGNRFLSRQQFILDFASRRIFKKIS